MFFVLCVDTVVIHVYRPRANKSLSMDFFVWNPICRAICCSTFAMKMAKTCVNVLACTQLNFTSDLSVSKQNNSNQNLFHIYKRGVGLNPLPTHSGSRDNYFLALAGDCEAAGSNPVLNLDDSANNLRFLIISHNLFLIQYSRRQISIVLQLPNLPCGVRTRLCMP